MFPLCAPDAIILPSGEKHTVHASTVDVVMRYHEGIKRINQRFFDVPGPASMVRTRFPC